MHEHSPLIQTFPPSVCDLIALPNPVYFFAPFFAATGWLVLLSPLSDPIAVNDVTDKLRCDAIHPELNRTYRRPGNI